MIKAVSYTILLVILTLGNIGAQDTDPVLFSVEGDPVRVSEFKYIYSKTNGDKANFSEASLDEYLQLYIKFKLKVKKAKALKLDTIQELKRELDGYRRQLADSYLINKEVTEALTKEAYERMKQDVEVNHIFFQLPASANTEDINRVRDRALSVKDQLDKGATFSTLARSYSEDKSVRTNAGRIGYISALFPKGFYTLETAAYSLPLETVSEPIRTPNGWHLIRITDRRPARGQVEVAHILLRTQNQVKREVRAKIEDLQKQLQDGASFETLAKEHSEDQRTASKSGYIGYIGINQFQEPFEDAAFAIPADGQISPIVESEIGMHLIKRISKKPLGTYAEEKSVIEALVKKDTRFEASKDALLENIKKNGNFQEFPIILERFIQTQNDTIFTFRWKAPLRGKSQVLMILNDQKINMEEFYTFLASATRQRMRLSGTTKVGDGIKSLYQDFVKDICLRYEEQQLEEKYPDFKSLMREYAEGILLFEVTKQHVWDKAAKDTSGLKAFYPQVKDKYNWAPKANITTYQIPIRANAMLQSVREYAVNHNPAEVKENFNFKDLSFTESTIEQGKSPEAKSIEKWEPGYLSIPRINRSAETYSFIKVESVTPSRPKTLSEAKGYIIADYQDFLEKEWVNLLRKEFDVKVNDAALNSMIKN